MRLRLVMRHWSVVIAIHAWWRGLVLDFRRVLIVQRRVQEVVAAHGGDGRRRRAFSQLDGGDNAASGMWMSRWLL